MVGVYGVVAYSAAQRTREIAIRIALGAHPAQILGTVMRQGTAIVSSGVLLGLLPAACLAKLMNSVLVGVSAFDPLAYGSAVGLVAAIALSACVLPARRVLKADPMLVLREQ